MKVQKLTRNHHLEAFMFWLRNEINEGFDMLDKENKLKNIKIHLSGNFIFGDDKEHFEISNFTLEPLEPLDNRKELEKCKNYINKESL